MTVMSQQFNFLNNGIHGCMGPMFLRRPAFHGIHMVQPSIAPMIRAKDGSESLEHIGEMEHGTIIAVGSGKQGKSCSLHSLIDRCFRDRPRYFLDSSDFDHTIFPDYEKVSNPDDIPVGSVAILEDVNRRFHSRGSSSDPTLQKWLGVISHKDIVVCLTTQSMADTDISFLRSQDTIILGKYMHPEDLEFERREFRSLQMAANHWIDRCSSSFREKDRRSWCFFPRFNECVSIPSVGWWDYEHSHMLRDVRVCS